MQIFFKFCIDGYGPSYGSRWVNGRRDSQWVSSVLTFFAIVQCIGADGPHCCNDGRAATKNNPSSKHPPFLLIFLVPAKPFDLHTCIFLSGDDSMTGNWKAALSAKAGWSALVQYRVFPEHRREKIRNADSFRILPRVPHTHAVKRIW